MINIIDGFYLGKSTPIDSRIVASGSVARNAIAYKYEGLRVYDTSDSTPYVWMNNSWEYENQNGVAASNTTASYVPLLTSTNVIGNSVIYQSSGKIGVNTTSPAHALDVNGYIRAGSGFIGDGSNVINMNVASASGKLPLANLTNATTNGYILVGGSPNPIYTNPSNFTIGRSDNAKINTEDSSSTEHYLIFATGSGGNYAPLKSNNTRLKFYPNTGKLFLNSSGTAASPVLAIGASTTGFYRKSSSEQLAICIGGTDIVTFNSWPGGCKIIKWEDFISEFTISNGSGSSNVFTFTEQPYDRYLLMKVDMSGSYISSGSFILKIRMGDPLMLIPLRTVIYEKYNSGYFFDNNFGFIVPAGEEVIVQCVSSSLVWSGAPPTFQIRHFKYGLDTHVYP